MKVSNKIVVVGSGPGGAITALNLLKSGFDVMLIEKGNSINIRDLKQYSYDEMYYKYKNAGLNVTLGSPRINYVEGSCFGGGSEVNSGLYHRLPSEKLTEWKDQFGLEYNPDHLEDIYNDIERKINISYADKEDIPPASYKLLEGSKNLGLDCLEIPRWVKKTKEGPVKQSMSETYLDEYIKIGGNYLCNASLLKIKKTNNLYYLDIKVDNKTVKYRCETLFLCCGSINSPFILRKSGIRKNIGNSLKLHPSFKFISKFTDNINHSNMGVPVHQIKGLENISMGCSISNKGYLSIGLNDSGNYSEIKNWEKLASYYVMISPYGSGKIRSFPYLNHPVVFYSLTSEDIKNLYKGIQILADVLFSAGAVSLFPSVNNKLTINNKMDVSKITALSQQKLNLMTIHLFSSLRMGKEKENFATNPYGKLWGYENIYINDGSILCDSPGVNPQGSIMAFAKYNVENFINEKKTNEV